MQRTLASAALAAALLAPAVSAVAQPAPAPARVVVRGTIASLTGDVLTVQTASGPLAVTLAPNFTVRSAVKASFQDLKPGTYIGAASLPNADGTLRATGIQIFPATGAPPDGHGPWNQAPGGTMTNAVVQQIDGATVAGVNGRVLTVTYKGGQQRIVVTPTTPVISFAAADRSALVAGAHVFVVARRDASGTLGAGNVTVGRNGVEIPV